MLQLCDDDWLLIDQINIRVGLGSTIGPNYTQHKESSYSVCAMFSPVVYWAGAEVLWLREVPVNEVLLCRVDKAERRNTTEFK